MYMKINLHFPSLGLFVSLLSFAVAASNCFAAATNAAASGLVRYDTVGGASQCKVEGTSTLHAWKMETTIVSGFIEALPGFPEAALTDANAARAVVRRVRIPLRTLKSGQEAMDNKMQEHMELTKYPNVEYNLLELKPKSPAGTQGAIEFDALGTLTIYGKTVTNTMPVTIEKKDGKLTVAGNAPVKMSDYGIPKLTAFGMTVGDDLKISFKWVSAVKAATP
jgi:polyisoprenoid-binding protein YceI